MKNTTSPHIIISTYDEITNPHYGGGGAVAIHQLAKRLVKKHNVTILTWKHSAISKDVIDGVTYEKFGLPFINPKLGMLLFQLCLPFFAYFKKYDIWIESFCPPFTTSFLPLFTKKPIVGVVHMLASADMKRKYGIDLGSVERLGLKKYKHIIVPNEFLQKKILSLNSNCDCIVISNGIDQVHTGEFKKKNQILFLGRIEVDQKGIDLLFRAFRSFTEKSKQQYTLIVAGSGMEEEMSKMKRLVSKNGLDASVVLKGKVEGRAKDTLIKESKCVVISSRFETHPLVALEAMSFGTPLVGFDIDGLQWVTSNVGIKVPAFDTEKLSDALLEITTNTSLQKKLKKNSLLHAAQYTWDKIAEKYDKNVSRIQQ